jgi:hypothetical protein
MKTSAGTLVLATIAMLFCVPGCASDPKTAASQSAKPKHIYLPPPTGSHIPQRVVVNRTGSTNAAPSSVEKVSPDALGEMQRRSSVNRGTGN